MFLLDAHCDTLHGMLIKKEKFSKNSLQIDYETLIKCSKSGILQFFAVFESPSNPMEKQKADVRTMIDSFHQVIDEFNIKIVLNKSDLNSAGIKALLSLEGLYFMEGDVDMIDSLYDDGVRCMSLTWNPDNEFSGGVSGNSGLGLSEKGFILVKKAFEKGILLDASHITDKGFWGIAEEAGKHKKPFVATHSNSRKLCGHKRNLNDKMLKALAGVGGVSGINMFACFLNDNCEAGIDDVIKHIEYICALTGPEHVGFGCDFDGIDKTKSAVSGPEALQVILERLLQLNYPENAVNGIASGNFLRVLAKVLD